MNAKWMIIGIMGATAAFGQVATNFEGAVNADRVNLRVRPDAATEVVAQVQEGQILSVVKAEGDWFGVLAPTNAGVWIKSQFVKDGIVAGDKIRLRSGPGIGYRDLGVIRKDTKVVVRETHGEWVRLAPPDDLVLWINKEMISPKVIPAPVVPVEVAPAPAPVAEKPIESPVGLTLPKDLPAGLGPEQLAPVLAQGAMVERTGVVERVPLSFLRGVDYRLVEMKDGRKITVCFLEGNDRQMPSLVGQKLKVKGREYWLKDQRYAVIYPELITPVVE